MIGSAATATWTFDLTLKDKVNIKLPAGDPLLETKLQRAVQHFRHSQNPAGMQGEEKELISLSD